jgi:diaminohydroxyphosphoribosylaminopyrimidine deaminase / 5-amino-6-(5-phosphoribosylamino)uracil reductase
VDSAPAQPGQLTETKAGAEQGRQVVPPEQRETGARVLDNAAPTLIAVADDADASHLEGRADILRLPRVDAGLDLELLLKALSERGVRAILLEGGPTLAGSFLAAGVIDQVVAYIAPVLIGGGGRSALAGPGALNIADAKRFQLDDVVRIGPDVRLTATPLK